MCCGMATGGGWGLSSGVASPPLVSEPSRVHGEGEAPTRGVRVAQADALEHARLACHRVPYLAERGVRVWARWRRGVEADEAVVVTWTWGGEGGTRARVRGLP